MPGKPVIPRRYHRHWALKTAVRRYGFHVLDGRTREAKRIKQWAADLMRDLGGAEALSMQERSIIELAVRTRLLLDPLDAWLLSQKHLVRKGAAPPVLAQRQQLADALARYLGLLGLARRTKPLGTLQEYLESRSAKTETPKDQHDGKGPEPTIRDE